VSQRFNTGTAETLTVMITLNFFRYMLRTLDTRFD